jgi:hypothetical protein
LHPPFEQWIREGPREQIPWQTRTHYYGLIGNQRLLVRIEVEIGIHELLKRSRDGQLIALVQVSDSAGHHFRDYKKEELKEVKVNENRIRSLSFYWTAFILPGEYQVMFVLYHGGTGEHNVTERKLKIPALHKDPLPEVWRNLPAVEFPNKDNHHDSGVRLYLPLETQRPVRIEILADVAASDQFRGSRAAYQEYLVPALRMINVFSQIEIGSGSMDIAVLDLARQRVIFQQEGFKELDSAKLQKVLAEIEAGTVSVEALRAKDLGLAFLRDELSRRINAPNLSDSGAEPPLRVFILISSPLWLYSSSSLKSDLLPEQCSCEVYYLQYDSRRWGPKIFDDIGNVRRMLQPLPLHVFSEHSALGVRQALARILREVSETVKSPEAKH